MLSKEPTLKNATEQIENLAEKFAGTLFASKLLHFYAAVYLLTGGIYMLCGGATDDKTQLIITLSLFCLEISHALLHSKVLFAVGTLANEDEYKDNRSYFIIDGLSCVVSYICLRYFNPDFSLSSTVAVAVLLDVLIHAYFVTMWKSGAEAVSGVIYWSSLPLCKRFNLVNIFNNMRFFGGTALDTSVHLYLACNLLRQCKSILRKLLEIHCRTSL